MILSKKDNNLPLTTSSPDWRAQDAIVLLGIACPRSRKTKIKQVSNNWVGVIGHFTVMINVTDCLVQNIEGLLGVGIDILEDGDDPQIITASF